jgi:ABC-type transport system involved in multi-copper enzyme maturation permease subunit
MFLLLLFATFAVALGVSFAVMWLFTKPIDRVLRRIIADEISAAWSKYMKFAILVVGVSSGVPVHDLERYVSATLAGREVQSAASLSFDRWIFELYRAGIEALQGIAWMLLVFFVFALIAYVIVRIGESRNEAKAATEPSDVTN